MSPPHPACQGRPQGRASLPAPRAAGRHGGRWRTQGRPTARRRRSSRWGRLSRPLTGRIRSFSLTKGASAHGPASRRHPGSLPGTASPQRRACHHAPLRPWPNCRRSWTYQRHRRPRSCLRGRGGTLPAGLLLRPLSPSLPQHPTESAPICRYHLPQQQPNQVIL